MNEMNDLKQPFGDFPIRLLLVLGGITYLAGTAGVLALAIPFALMAEQYWLAYLAPVLICCGAIVDLFYTRKWPRGYAGLAMALILAFSILGLRATTGIPENLVVIATMLNSVGFGAIGLALIALAKYLRPNLAGLTPDQSLKIYLWLLMLAAVSAEVILIWLTIG